MCRDYKDREKFIEDKKHEHLSNKFRYVSESEQIFEEDSGMEEECDTDAMEDEQHELSESDDDNIGIRELAQIDVSCNDAILVNVHEVLSSSFQSITNDKNIYEHQ